jgi:hypothetical protein
LHEVAACASELPGETDEFARALGFASRSKLQNNGGGLAHKLQGASTESVDLPWKDCEALVGNAPNQIFWHHWPDAKLHDGSGAGQGLEPLTKDVVEQLSSDDFWAFVSDHGYAATGYFPDADGEVGQFLKQDLRQRAQHQRAPVRPAPSCRPWHYRSTARTALTSWPSAARKWKSQGGYPTLTHGGLSLLEVLSPFVELTK